MKITKCKQCPLVKLRKADSCTPYFVDIYECHVQGRQVNPETRPDSCTYPEMHGYKNE